ncbi:MAG: CHAT domain-containing protein, partial [Ignavibacteriae bacterium]|nr:CHAT domain-containing protein [Ignavibacteriota bacterium]
SGDENLVNKYNELISFKTKIIKSQDLTIEERKKRGLNLEEYEQKAEELEKELSRTAGIEITQKVSWTDVKNSLKQNEVALEFVDFRLYDKRWTDTTLYCALVVKKDYPYPKLIQLCTEKDLNDILSVSPEKTDSYIRNNNTSKELYKLIFKPFEGELKGADKIYISPSGLVNRISLNSLMTDANEMLIDKYNLYYTGNLKDIIHNEEENKINPNSFNVAVFGGADFDLDSTSLVLNSQKYQISDENRGIKPIVPDSIRKQYESTKLFIGGKWVYLKGTLDEAEKINDIFKQNGITADVFEKGEATESALKSLSYSKQKNSPTVLHIATHGFFFPDISRDYNKMELQRNFGQEMKLQISENPLRRSGLILAGANRFWQGENNIEGVDDGIVTAEEVSMLDLRNTELVVLSACETGLGDIKGGEGVYGLQRAFKVAGAKTIIMSLWKVPDKETVELMELFYTN